MEHDLPPTHHYRLVLDDAFSRLRQKQGKPDDALALAQHAADGARATLPETGPERRKFDQHLAELLSARPPTATAEPGVPPPVVERHSAFPSVPAESPAAANPDARSPVVSPDAPSGHPPAG